MNRHVVFGVLLAGLGVVTGGWGQMFEMFRGDPGGVLYGPTFLGFSFLYASTAIEFISLVTFFLPKIASDFIKVK